jgi:hypothetical protein
MRYKILAAIVASYISVIVFMPKEQILYTALNIVKKYKVGVTFKDHKDRWFYQSIQKMTISYDKGVLANATNIKITPLIFYNRLSISDLKASGSFKSLFSYSATSTVISYSIINPLRVKIFSNGDFGEVNGFYEVTTSKIKLMLTPSKDFESSQFITNFTKSDKGYIYESTIR